jgi:peptidyl-prolyl cis-trans isomerase B (cyclophilin B)
MPSSRRTRERQLSKLADRRRRERQRVHRRKMVATGIVVAVVLAGAGSGLFLLAKGGKKPAAAASASPTPSASAPPTVACGGTVPKAAGQEKKTYKKAPKLTIDKSKSYTATMVTSCGKIVMKLDPKLAPDAVNSIVFLARQHFYDGLTFHRLARDFVIQGGDPLGDGTGDPGYKTVDAPPKDASYPKGTVAMAKGTDEQAGTAGSQFFIVIGSDTGLTADYAIVGTVQKGQDVADKIGQLPIQNGASDGPPVDTVYIVKVTIKES